MNAQDGEGDLDALLTYLRDVRGFDFTGYKRPSLSRRITKRMHTVDADDYQRYLSVLEANPGEFVELFNTILINVTGFLRDREAWDYLAGSVIPAIVAAKGPSDVIRVWSAGCASGEEAYSLAVLLADAIGEQRFSQHVKLYATDVDEEALARARHARYPHADLVGAFGEERAARYFDSDGTTSVFRQDLRHALIFGRHDVIQDPPISRVDLLVCRNTLMYFTADAQRRALSAFHYGLSPRGYLFLGKSEALVTRTNLFEAVDLHQHVFRKDSSADPERPAHPTGSLAHPQPAARDTGNRFTDAAVELSPIAQLVVDRSGHLVVANRHARDLFGIGAGDIGRPLRDLEISYRPVDLRSPLEQALRDRRPVPITDVEWDPPAGRKQYLDVHLLPLGETPPLLGVAITFTEVGRYRLLREELERSQGELEAAYEELQSVVEELETTNEELQSTNEELETTNEEIHSTNEELETMNEELQSTNEELETINNELRVRTSQLDDVNQFLQSILGSLHSGVVVLDRELHVREWSRQAEELWGLRPEEVEGRHFLNLDIGLPVDRLRAAIRGVLTASSEREQVVLAAVNRRGRSIECSVSVSPLTAGGDAGDPPAGVIILMDPVPG
ncbi:PAS domain-containing protein [Acidimicrobiaceae bacterium USS-CC1]|uniref:protein-glutamate O-methyltransferase n=1 Tax=Acidiferrimicrobium australe TaxID=2664430 RepID=A0ABW9QTN2_9ACTN|nr:PAS domain-containing protein [Acidiferrimicrobium australe]